MTKKCNCVIKIDIPFIPNDIFLQRIKIIKSVLVMKLIFLFYKSNQTILQDTLFSICLVALLLPRSDTMMDLVSFTEKMNICQFCDNKQAPLQLPMIRTRVHNAIFQDVMTFFRSFFIYKWKEVKCIFNNIIFH